MNNRISINWIAFIFRFLPLASFVGYAFWGGAPSKIRWLHAFLLGGALAIVQLVIFFSRKEPINRLILSSSLYLITGGISVVMGWIEILEQFYNYKEVGVLIYMLVVGVITSLFTPSGFIGTSHGSNDIIRRYSAFLCFATAVALLISITFKGNYLFSAVIPITALVFFNKHLAHKTIRNVSINKSNSN